VLTVATVEDCTGCDGSSQHSSGLNNTYDVPWNVWVHDDRVCVELENPGQTNASVNLWVEDDESNGPISDQSHWVAVPPGTKVYQCFSGFGVRADQTTPVDSCILHTVVRNDDDESQGVHLYYAVY
jgi:hypothetical protein